MYKCEVAADSLNTFGNRITTFKLTYPRIVHAELMTHRLFSRNAASSRAVPVKKMIESVKNNMFTPLAIQKSHKGMQGSNYFEGEELEQAKQLWIKSAELTLQIAEKMEKFGITKQLINRILEPYQYYQVLVTATEWENFFSLRCPQYYYEPENLYFKSKKDWNKKWLECFDKLPYSPEEELIFFLNINKSQAEIHIQKIAEMIWDCYNESEPKTLQAGEWHIPFGDNFDGFKLIDMAHKIITKNNPECSPDELQTVVTKLGLKVATARCARTSYMTFDGAIDYEKDIELHDKLIGPPFHASPFEHCARAMNDEEYSTFIKGKCEVNPYTEEVVSPAMNEGWCNNFKGFIQYRYLLENS